MRTLLLLLALCVSSTAGSVTPWGPACTEWHYSQDGLFPIAIWNANTDPWSYCYPDRAWPPCNQPPEIVVNLSLLQLDVPLDAKEALFEGVILATPSTTATNAAVVSIKFCAPSVACDFSRQNTYTYMQSGSVPIGARSPVTIHAPIEAGWIKYMWRYHPQVANEYAGVSLTLRGWCR